MSNRIPYHNPAYPYSRPPNTLYTPPPLDPIAALAQAEAEGRELTREQKDLAWKLITAAWDQSTEE
jgi:hypothetical protein